MAGAVDAGTGCTREARKTRRWRRPFSDVTLLALLDLALRTDEAAAYLAESDPDLVTALGTGALALRTAVARELGLPS